MTREEAREILTHNWTRVDNPNYSESELDEAFFMAIEALSDRPTEEYEHKKVAAVAAKAFEEKAAAASKAKAAASPKAKVQSKRKKIDWPKAEACRKAGWDYTKIADELGCSYATVYNHFNVKGATK